MSGDNLNPQTTDHKVGLILFYLEPSAVAAAGEVPEPAV
jgi:hypothetical protein